MKNIISCLLLLTLALTSCGARKSNSSTLETKERSQIEINSVEDTKSQTNLDTNVKTSVTVETNEKTGEVIETTVDEPIDNTKPATVIDENGSKTELNNSKRTKTKRTILGDKQTKAVTNIDANEKVSQIDQKHAEVKSKATTDKRSKAKAKETDREAVSFAWLWWFLLLIPLARIIYCIKTKTPLL